MRTVTDGACGLAAGRCAGAAPRSGSRAWGSAGEGGAGRETGTAGPRLALVDGGPGVLSMSRGDAARGSRPGKLSDGAINEAGGGRRGSAVSEASGDATGIRGLKPSSTAGRVEGLGWVSPRSRKPGMDGGPERGATVGLL
jgi:hypothetical protein